MTLPRFSRVLFAIGATLGAAFIAIAAYAAHGLDAPVRAVDQALLIHAAQLPGILTAALLARPLAAIAGGLLVLGTALFCGSLYAHYLFGLGTVAAAPFGGTLLILGWLLLAAAGARASGR